MSAQGNITLVHKASEPIDPGVRIGHTYLRTADIDRIRAFYVDLLGFDVVAEARDVPGWAPPATSCSCPPAGITTTSVSIHGNPRAASRSRTASPAFTTWRSPTRRARRSPTATAG